MPLKIFIDTNILLRATVVQFPNYALVKPFVERYISQGDELWISGQIIREYFNQVTRPQSFMQPMDAAQIDTQYKKIRTVFRIAYETQAVIEQFVALLQTHPTAGKQVHDANIAATMHVYGIHTLLTLNVADFKRFSDTLTLISPVKET